MGRIYSSLATLSRVLLKGGFSDNPGQKSWDTFAKTPQIRASPLHPQCNVDLKGSSHPESLQALSTLLGVGGGRAVTKTVRYKQSNRLTQGIFHKCPILRVFFPGVPRTFGQDCTCEFADIDKEIKLQIILSCSSQRLCRKALKDTTMTLQALLDEARALEVSEKQAVDIESSGSANAVFPQKSKMPEKKSICFNCGESWPHDSGGCPARNRKCNSCQRYGHYAKCCCNGRRSSNPV